MSDNKEAHFRGKPRRAVFALMGLMLAVPLRADTCTPRWGYDNLAAGANGRVRVLTPSSDGKVLYAGGEFTLIGGVPANHVAQFDGTRWTPLGEGFDKTVWALAVIDLGTGPALYAGGDFTASGATAIAHIARWDGTHWAQLGTGIAGSVYAIAEYKYDNQTLLFAGGQFTSPANGIASWNGATWSSLTGGGVTTTTFPPVCIVQALNVFDAGTGLELYVAGQFNKAGSISAKNIARWNGTQWAALGEGTANGTSNPVNAMAVFDDGTSKALYVAGSFINAGNVTDTRRIARWNGSEWSALGQGLGDAPVHTLAVFDDGTGSALYAGGQFTNAVGSMETRRIAKWNGTTWSSQGGGIPDDNSDPCWCHLPDCSCGPRPATVNALATYGNALHVGGDFNFTGCIATPNLVQWSCLPTKTVRPDFNWDGQVNSVDWDFFASCETGPALGPPSDPCCQSADLNNDGSIDAADFAIFQRCLTLPGIEPLVACE